MCFAYAWSYWPVGTDKSQYMHAFAYGVQLSRTEDKLKMAEDAQSAGYGGGGG